MRTINRYVVATGLLLVRANAGSRRRLDVVVEPWRAALLMYGGHCTHVRTPARTSIVVASVVVFTATAAVDARGGAKHRQTPGAASTSWSLRTSW